MTKSSLSNYPDILGYITGGSRLNLNVVQLAIAVRPRVVRAGRPFEAILLIQNASDVNVDVSVRLRLPEVDAQKKKGRFITKSERLVVGLRAAEVGYVQLPLSALPDTAVHDAYKVGMDVEVKPLAKARRIRQEEGGGEVVLEFLADEKVVALNDLKKYSYSTEKRGMRGPTLEATFGLLTAQIGKLLDLKPGWVSLWTMSDHMDDRVLLQRHRELMLKRVLPSLNQETLLAPLEETTLQRIAGTGYAIDALEARYIAKLLMMVLAQAAPPEESYEPLAQEQYHVARLLKPDREEEEVLTLPSWCRGMLRALDRDQTIVQQPVQALAGTLYDELLRDAVIYGFHVLHKVTGEQLGSDEDVKAYTERLVHMILTGEPRMTFTDLYLPLVLGGVVFYDRFPTEGERVSDTLVEMAQVFTQRRATEKNEDNEPVFKIAEPLFDRLLQKYGYNL